jgi:hypothetical protein
LNGCTAISAGNIYNSLSLCVPLNRIEELLGQGATTEGINDELVDSDDDEIGDDGDEEPDAVKE